MENKFMRVEEVAEVLEVSTSFAYKVIRQLNDELKAKGLCPGTHGHPAYYHRHPAKNPGGRGREVQLCQRL